MRKIILQKFCKDHNLFNWSCFRKVILSFCSLRPNLGHVSELIAYCPIRVNNMTFMSTASLNYYCEISTIIQISPKKRVCTNPFRLNKILHTITIQKIHFHQDVVTFLEYLREFFYEIYLKSLNKGATKKNCILSWTFR